MIHETFVRDRNHRNLRISRGIEKRKRPRQVVGVWSWLWLVITLWILVIYLLVNFRLPRVLPGEDNIYLAQPLTWTSLSVLAYLGWRFGLSHRPALDKRLVVMGILTGVFQVALFIIAGLLLGFGHSPYSHRLLHALGNLFYLSTMLVAVEISRAYLVRIFSLGNRTLAVVTTSLLLACLSIPAAKFTSVADAPSLFKFYGVTFLPAFSEHLLASFLTLLGGPVVPIAYRAVLQAFEWLSPVLPNLPWTVTAFLGTMAPAFGLIVIRNQVLPMATSRGGETQTREKQLSTAWVLMVGLAVTLMWFNIGLFGIRPTLVSGVSMIPALRAGDVVITRDVPADEIDVGDIISFQHGDSHVIHRVIDIEKEGGRYYFITRGDANNVEDPPVLESQLDGKVILIVPKIGWLSIGVRNLWGSIR